MNTQNKDECSIAQNNDLIIRSSIFRNNAVDNYCPTVCRFEYTLSDIMNYAGTVNSLISGNLMVTLILPIATMCKQLGSG